MEPTVASTFWRIKNGKQILLHIGIWTIFVFMHLIQTRPNQDLINLSSSFLFVVNIILFYLNYLVLVPKLLLRKKTGLYVFCAFVFIVFFTYLFREIDTKTDQSFMFLEHGPRHFFIGMKSIMVAVNSFLILAIGTVIRMYSEWSSNEISKKQIEAQKSTSELHFLKNQISYHSKLLIKQEYIPEIQLNKTFCTEHDAEKVAHLVCEKLYKKESPKITLENLNKLNINLNCNN